MFGSISDSYSTGSVSGKTNVGGLCGLNDKSIINCFWDIETSGHATSDGGTGKTTAEMMQETTFTGWDFSTPVWKIVRETEDYPRLSYQEETVGDFAGLWGVDYTDFSFFSSRWMEINCDALNDCDGADLDLSTDVGIGDLLIFV